MDHLSHTLPLDVNDIQKIIPHRPPFLMIDRIVDTDFKTYVVALKNVTVNEPFFAGHFPGAPVMPGVLIVEAMAQAAAIVALAQPSSKGKFRKPVVPGDQLVIRIELLRMRETAGKCSAVAKVGDTVVTEAILAFAIADPPRKAAS